MTPATDPLPTGAMLSWARHVVGPVGEPTLLSRSNSLLWRLPGARGDYVLKHLTDPSSDLEAETALLAALPPHAPFRRPLAVRRLADGSALTLAAYVEGPCLADVLATAPTATAQDWAGQWHAMMRLVAARPASGFGKADARGHAEHRTWSGFLSAYLERQRRKAPRLAALRYAPLAETLTRLRAPLDRAAPVPTLLSADVNHRNFLVTADGLHCVNVPVLWAGDPAACYGEALVHWDGSHGARRLVELSGAPAWRLHWYAAFHAYVILAFVERFSPEPLAEARPWGGRSPLLSLLDRHLTALRASLVLSEETACR
ncbi:hypothetical protein [Streptomyces sp. AN091965]|uniref:hypothetical protein n=1 Tax=Streptomyces sp. AN091965 TaxID=2927803 RepID=UPI001F6005D9|nr:hypothetical protein [Streptomyces sp. AN091965]MCI3934367.1 hypothetical protein [Streptomyces sp. AN091965]